MPVVTEDDKPRHVPLWAWVFFALLLLALALLLAWIGLSWYLVTHSARL